MVSKASSKARSSPRELGCPRLWAGSSAEPGNPEPQRRVSQGTSRGHDRKAPPRSASFVHRDPHRSSRRRAARSCLRQRRRGGGRFTISANHFTAYSCKFHHRTAAGGYRYECIGGAHYTGVAMGYYDGTVCAQSLNNRWTLYDRAC